MAVLQGRISGNGGADERGAYLYVPKIINARVISEAFIGLFAMAITVGTNTIAKKLAELTGKEAVTIIEGGDSVATIEKAGFADHMSHISIGGSASLKLLEGKPLPGVLALDDA